MASVASKFQLRKKYFLSVKIPFLWQWQNYILFLILYRGNEILLFEWLRELFCFLNGTMLLYIQFPKYCDSKIEERESFPIIPISAFCLASGNTFPSFKYFCKAHLYSIGSSQRIRAICSKANIPRLCSETDCVDTI